MAGAPIKSDSLVAAVQAICTYTLQKEDLCQMCADEDALAFRSAVFSTEPADQTQGVSVKSVQALFKVPEYQKGAAEEVEHPALVASITVMEAQLNALIRPIKPFASNDDVKNFTAVAAKVKECITCMQPARTALAEALRAVMVNGAQLKSDLQARFLILLQIFIEPQVEAGPLSPLTQSLAHHMLEENGFAESDQSDLCNWLQAQEHVGLQLSDTHVGVGAPANRDRGSTDMTGLDFGRSFSGPSSLRGSFADFLGGHGSRRPNFPAMRSYKCLLWLAAAVFISASTTGGAFLGRDKAAGDSKDMWTAVAAIIGLVASVAVLGLIFAVDHLLHSDQRRQLFLGRPEGRSSGGTAVVAVKNPMQQAQAAVFAPPPRLPARPSILSQNPGQVVWSDASRRLSLANTDELVRQH